MKLAPGYKIFFYNGSFLLCGIVLIELVFGNWFSRNRMNRLNLIRNVTYVENIDGLYPSDEPQFRYSRDQFGFRGNYTSPREIDILLIGGSTTDERRVSDDKTWGSVLQKRLDDFQLKYTVVNAGVSGQSSLGHLKEFDWWFPFVTGLHPKYFVVYVGINEVLSLFQNRTEQYQYEMGNGLFPESWWKSTVKERSAIYLIVRQIKGMQRFYIDPLTKTAEQKRIPWYEREKWDDKPIFHDHSNYAEAYLKVYGERMGEILRRAKTDFDASVFLVTQRTAMLRDKTHHLRGIGKAPSGNGPLVNGIDWSIFLGLINQATREICGEHENCVLIDLAHDLSLEPSDFFDFIHTNPEGSKKIGLYLAENLRKYLP